MYSYNLYTYIYIYGICLYCIPFSTIERRAFFGFLTFPRWFALYIDPKNWKIPRMAFSYGALGVFGWQDHQENTSWFQGGEAVNGKDKSWKVFWHGWNTLYLEKNNPWNKLVPYNQWNQKIHGKSLNLYCSNVAVLQVFWFSQVISWESIHGFPVLQGFR